MQTRTTGAAAGGATDGGGIGGGLVRITAGTVSLDGQVLADGTYARYGGGSGGGIYVSADVLEGNGNIRAAGGDGSGYGGGGGGGGRIAVYAADASGFDLDLITAPGGVGYGGGGAGTVYLLDTDDSYETLIIDNRDGGGGITPLDTLTVGGTVNVLGGSILEVNGPLEVVGSLTVDNSTVRATSVQTSQLSLINSATLTTFDATATDVHKLELTVADTLVVDSTSKIDVSGKGYLPGYTTGNTTDGAATGHSGGSYGGLGNNGNTGQSNVVYDDYADPNDWGSGGGATDGGGIGGGLVRITAGTVSLDGQVLADGTYARYGGGSGGGIYVSADVLEGNGNIRAAGGDGSGYGGGGGGGGRIAVYAADASGFDLDLITAPGGVGYGGGGAGTVYLLDTDDSYETLIIDNRDGGGGITPLDTLTVGGTVNVLGGSILEVNGPLEVVGSLTVDNSTVRATSVQTSQLSLINSATLTTFDATATDVHKLELTVADTLVVDSTSKIDVSGKGYLPGYTTGNTTDGAATGHSGGSYGGLGNNGNTGQSNVVYDDYADPNDWGSGGGATDGGGIGGGLVRITAGTVSLDGQIVADGGSANYGGGSGGGIYVSAGALEGSGSIRAAGGDGSGYGGGGGGGGQIAVHAADVSGFDLDSITAPGGVGYGGGGAGTVYLLDTDDTYETLIIDNRDGGGGVTPLDLQTDGKLTVGGTINVLGGSILEVNGPLEVGGSLTVDNSTLRATSIQTSQLSLINSATLTTFDATATEVYKVELVVSGTLAVDTTSKIDVSDKGYLPAYTSGNTTEGGATGNSGGSYGGLGAAYSGQTGTTYGSDANPNDWGSGGAGGRGGGLVRISADTVWLGGQVLADGQASNYGAGSGGGILVSAGTILGSGGIRASGGDGNRGGGGGGRIAVYASDLSRFDRDAVTAPGSGWRPGEPGTVHIVEGLAPTFVFAHRPESVTTDALDHLELTFTTPIDTAFFDASDLDILGPDGRVFATDMALVSGKTYRITVPSLTANGKYQFRLNPTLLDSQARKLDQNANGVPGEAGDSYSWNLLVDSIGPRVNRHIPSGDNAGTVDHVDIWFSEPIDPDTFTAGDIRITGPAGAIVATGTTAIGNNGYRISFAAQTEYGQYHVQVGPDVRDVAGNRMDQDRDGVRGEPDDGEQSGDDDIYDATFNLVDVDLTLFNAGVTETELWAGEPVHVSWEGKNESGSPLFGDWTDAVYLSTDVLWDIDDVLLATVDHTGGLAQNETYFQSVDPAVPGTPPGDYYIIVRADLYNQEKETGDEGNNVVVLGPFPLQLRALAADGVPVSGTLNTSDSADIYAIQTPPGEGLDVVLDADGGHNELYVGYDRIPTRQDYDLRLISEGPDVDLLVPGTLLGGTYYIMAYGSGSTTVDYSLSAEGLELAVIDWTPREVGESGETVMAIQGYGFVPGTSVELVRDGGASIVADWATAFSTQSLEATFVEGSLSPGTYDLRVIQPGEGETIVVADAVTVVPGGEAVLETNLITPGVIGWHMTATIYVEYANTGTIAMPAPLLVLSANCQGEEGAFLTLDQSIVQDGFWTSAEPEGFSHSIQFLASGETPGLLQPGESCRVPVYYAGWQKPWHFGSPINFTLGVLAADDTTPADWSSMEESLRPDDMPEEAWSRIYAGFTAEVGDTWGDYVSMLSENAVYLRRLGETVTDVSELMAFELAQAQGYSVLGTLAGGTDAIASGPGIDIAFSRSYAESLVSRYELGSFGYGWTNNWDMSVSTRDDGTVEIDYPGGSKRIFQPSVRGGYLARPGDNGTLTDRTGGGYLLQELGGSVYAFTAGGKLDYVEDTNANRITCGYDAQGRLETLAHSNGIAAVTLAYNPAGRIGSVTDQDGRETTYTYDASGDHLLEVTGYDGLGVGYAYDDAHALSEIAYADGTHTFYEYNGLEQLIALYADGGAGRVEITHGDGGLVSMADTPGGRTDYYFNQDGAIEKTVDPLGRAVEMDYDTLGNLTRMSDPLGRSTTYAYDDLGNVVRSTNALGYSTRFSYTSRFNQLDLLTDAAGNVTDYDYDAAGNLVSITYADGSLERWEYDATGNVDEWINRRGQSVEYTLDSEGRVTSREYEDGTSVTFTYDARGNLTESVDPTGTTTYTYDANDYLTKIDYPDGRFLEYTYDTAGRRASMTDELGHQTNYAYDSLGRLHQLTDETAAPIITYTYDTLSRLARADKANGTYTVYDYDAAGQLTALFNYAPNDSVSSKFEYAYDAAGLRTSMETLDGTWTYEYDVIGQLTHAVFAPAAGSTLAAQDLLYEYDAVGNRIRTVINGVETDYTANSLNQYTQVGDTLYEYDDDGNLIRETTGGQGTEYVYDVDNRLVMVSKPDGSVYEYTYDAFGNRVAVSENGVVTEYVIDPVGLGNVVGEYDASGARQAGYTHGLGLVNQTTAAGSYFYDFDALGSTAAITDALGSVVTSYAYLPFGGELEWTEQIANDFQFVGQWGVMNEGSGLEFMRARYYDAGVGSFVAADPIGQLGGINVYEYAKNAPVLAIDPSGLLNKMTINGFAAPAAVQRKLAAQMQGVMEGVKEVMVDTLIVSGVAVFSLLNMSTFGGPVAVVEAGKIGAGGATGMAPYARTIVQPWMKPIVTVLAEMIAVEAILPSVLLCTGSSNSVRSWDPNDKLGPAGFGDDNYIAVSADQSTLMPYTIRFENKEDATAPAQWIRITDTFDEDLDLDTFELTEFMFGGEVFAIPAGLDSYQARIARAIEGHDLVIDVAITLDRTERTLSASFLCLDPDTGWMPEDPMIGLLYPNDDMGRGDGHIAYVVNTVDGLASGTEITNKARIYFDWNDPIDTPLVLNTVDAEAPTGRIEPFDDTTPGYVTGVTVRWSGEDDANGSGVAGYDIYYRADGEEEYTLWLESTPNTEATFSGIGTEGVERTYEFYAVPIDNVGHRRPLAAASPADATVTFTQALPGDLNLDGFAGSADLDIVRANWGQAVPAGDLSQGDPSGDGTVGSADLDIIRANWGAGIPAAAAQADPQGSAPTSSSSPYGPRQQSAADAALSSLANSGLHQGLSDADLATLAEAAWLQEIERLRTKGTRQGAERGILSGMILTGVGQ